MANGNGGYEKLSKAELIQRLKAAENGGGTLSLKVAQKGGISLYGLQRRPVTLYTEQWTRLLDHGDAIRAFQKAHDKELKHKGDE